MIFPKFIQYILQIHILYLDLNVDETTSNQKLRRELLKCANSPQGANKHTDGFLCCDEHVKLLQKKGLQPNKINTFVTWYCLKKELNKLDDKLKKLENEDGKNKDKIDAAKLVKEKIQHTLSKFSDDDVKMFVSVRDHGKVLRKSARINHKARADMNECVQMLNDSEYLENVERKLGEKNVSSELIQVRASMFIII